MAREHLLLIEADTKDAAVMELALRRSGYSVATAADYEAARKEFGDADPSLIVLDLDSANDVESLIAQLKGPGAPWRQTPCIYICSETSRSLIKEDLRPGSEDCMARPLYLQELGTRVALVLNQKRRSRWTSRDQGRNRFSGQITELGVVDLLQTIDHCKKSGVVNLEAAGDSGQLWFSEGRLIDASFGQLQAEAAVFRMIRLDSGRYGVQFKPVRRARALSSKMHELLHEGLIQLDKWHRLCEQLPSLDLPLQANPEQGKTLGSDAHSSDVRALLRRFGGTMSIRRVIEETRRNDLELLEIISEVYFSGALVPVAEAEGAAENCEEAEEVNCALDQEKAKSSSRPVSTTEPMIKAGGSNFVKRRQAKTQLIREEQVSSSPRPRSGTLPLGQGRRESARTAAEPVSPVPANRPRFVRTQIIPRENTASPKMAQDAPVVDASRAHSGKRRPVSATIMYHEDERTRPPFQSMDGNAALARDFQEQVEPEYQSPPAANDDPSAYPQSEIQPEEATEAAEELEEGELIPALDFSRPTMSMALDEDEKLSSFYSLAVTVGCFVVVSLVLSAPLWKSSPRAKLENPEATPLQGQETLLDPGALSPDERTIPAPPRWAPLSSSCCAPLLSEPVQEGRALPERAESFESDAMSLPEEPKRP